MYPNTWKKSAKTNTTLKTYEGIRSYITEQIASNREVKNTSKGPVPMDLNAMVDSLWADDYDTNGNDTNDTNGNDTHCEPCYDGNDTNGNDTNDKVFQLFSFIKGLKGKGKGKGGPGKGGGKMFEGTCNHCGIYGHRIADCWKKDEAMGKRWKRIFKTF